MKQFSVVLPLPSDECHQNARVHHLALARAKQHDRYWGFNITRATLAGKEPPRWSRAKVALHFYFPNRRGRDLLNYAAACKSLLDGVVEAGIIADDKCTVLERVSSITWEVYKEHVGVRLTFYGIEEEVAA